MGYNNVITMEGCMIRKGFTLSEVLIALGVIGVVAAITMPRFINNINEKQYDTGRTVALSMIGEAGKRIAFSGEMNTSYNAQQFIDNILKKYLNIVKTCTPGNFAECGWNNEVESFNGTKLTFKHDTFQGSFSDINKQSATNYAACFNNNLNGTCGDSNYFRAFLAKNGYAFILYYNPYCAPEKYTGGFQYPQNKICMQVLYDMNGLKGPNKYGKDIGHITVFNGNETTYSVAPKVVNMEATGDLSYADAVSFCSSKGQDYVLPTIDELLSLSFSKSFTNLNDTSYFLSSTNYRNNSYYTMKAYVAMAYSGNSGVVICVKH